MHMHMHMHMQVFDDAGGGGGAGDGAGGESGGATPRTTLDEFSAQELIFVLIAEDEVKQQHHGTKGCAAEGLATAQAHTRDRAEIALTLVPGAALSLAEIAVEMAC